MINMAYDSLKLFLRKKFIFSICLHILYGFIFEKSKLYYPYVFDRNLLLIKTDLYKYYFSTCFILLGMPYVLSKISPKKYFQARVTIENRYQNRSSFELQVGSYLLGLSLILTGFCSSYLSMYLAISPILFLYSVATSYTAYIFYHVFARLFSNRVNTGPINQNNINNNNTNNTPSVSNDKETLNNIGRLLILSLGIILSLMLEGSEQSIPPGHSPDELIDLVYSGDYLPPGLTGLLCGIINFLLLFICDEYQTLTSEWLINIFYYTSEFTLDRTNITGQLCTEQILKILSMSFGVRLSLWMSYRQEIPRIDWLFYLLVGCGSFISSLSYCLTTATFTDHVYLVNAFMIKISAEIIAAALAAAWMLLYFAKLLGL